MENSQNGMTLLPYELINIIGELSEWNSLIACALTCRDWYTWLVGFPWTEIMPMYKPASNKGYNFNAMNLFCMLINVRKQLSTSNSCRLGNYWLHQDSIESKSIHELQLFCGIPLLYQPNKADYKFDTKDEFIEFLNNTWCVNELKNKNSLNLITMPDVVRKYINEDRFDRFDFDTMKPMYFIKKQDTNHDFYSHGIVLGYSGIVDVLVNDVEITLLSRDYCYTIDKFTLLETNRHELNFNGYKFLGFDNNHVCVYTIYKTFIYKYERPKWTLVNGVIYKDESYDRKGWYLYCNGNRLNINKLSTSDINDFRKMDKIENIMQDNESLINQILYDKKGEDPVQNLFQSYGYTADFWSLPEFNENLVEAGAFIGDKDHDPSFEEPLIIKDLDTIANLDEDVLFD
jgi:hypothetical protein